MRKFEVTGISYDFDGLEPEKIPALPTCMVVECDDEEGVIDAISDETGWLIESVLTINELLD